MYKICLKIFNNLNIFLNILIDFFSPKICCVCSSYLKTDEQYICVKCSDNLLKIDQNNCCKFCGYPFQTNKNQKSNFLDKKKIICPSCQSGKRYFDIARSVYQYKGDIKKLLLNFKYYFQTETLDFFGKSLFEVYCLLPQVDFICFIPITKQKLFCKGFNHSALITNSLMKFIKKNNQYPPIVLHDLIIKTHKTIQSKHLSQHERWNKKYNFEIKKSFLNEMFKQQFNGKTFLIVDDIMTTGATLNTASLLIKENFSNSKIICLTFARTMLY